jgi:hypothetical protein
MYRQVLFYLLLSLPVVLWAGIVLPFNSWPDISAAVVYWIVAAFPLVTSDISIFGEITPVILAGAIIALRPSTTLSNIIACIVCIIIYLLYIYLSVFFLKERGVALLSYTSGGDYVASQKTILAFVSNIRIMSIVVAASILGFEVKNSKREVTHDDAADHC